MTDRERELSELCARLDDIRARAVAGELGISRFLSEAEVKRAEIYLKNGSERFFFWGGYADAERKRAYILPEYMDISDGAFERLLEEYGFEPQIQALLITGSGYERLSHRDFLGSLIGLGIERAALGDIIVLPDGDKSAVAFCDSRIASFICAELTKVSRDKVRVSVTEIKEDFIPERKFVDINEPISSTRLDCIVCALCSVSRERASELISAGLVEIDFETEEKPDRRIEMPCVATVRGFGKYKLLRADAKTRKGRLRLEAKKYS